MYKGLEQEIKDYFNEFETLEDLNDANDDFLIEVETIYLNRKNELFFKKLKSQH